MVFFSFDRRKSKAFKKWSLDHNKNAFSPFTEREINHTGSHSYVVRGGFSIERKRGKRREERKKNGKSERKKERKK